jgi:uncharacterized alkaline shock family protein YloU
MVTAFERQNDNLLTVDLYMTELVSHSKDEVAVEAQIILQQSALPEVALDVMEKIKQALITRTGINIEEEVPLTQYVSKKTKKHNI